MTGEKRKFRLSLVDADDPVEVNATDYRVTDGCLFFENKPNPYNTSLVACFAAGTWLEIAEITEE